MKYHISKDGKVRRCHAKGACPLGGTGVHFKTKEEAQAVVDKVMKKKYGVGVSKDSK